MTHPLGRAHDNCPYCGKIKSRDSKRCWECRIKGIGGDYRKPKNEN